MNNWGRIKGGLNSPGNTKQIKKIKYTANLAEFLGILFGDGNSYVKKAYKVGVYAIRIVGDSRYDKKYIVRYVKPLGEHLFGICGKISYSKVSNAIILSFYSREMLHALKKLGFPSGNKIQNKLTIPLWIRNKKSHLKKFIRGLLDTDGSIFKMSNKYPYLLRIDFTSHIPSLLNEVRSCFLEMNFNPSNIISGKHFFLSRKADVLLYRQIIGFSNPKHINRAILLASVIAPSSSGQILLKTKG